MSLAYLQKDEAEPKTHRYPFWKADEEEVVDSPLGLGTKCYLQGQEGPYKAIYILSGCQFRAYYRDGKLTEVISKGNRLVGYDLTEWLRPKISDTAHSSVMYVDYTATLPRTQTRRDARKDNAGLFKGGVIDYDTWKNDLRVFPLFGTNKKGEIVTKGETIGGNCPYISAATSKFEATSTAWIGSSIYAGGVEQSFPVDGILMYDLETQHKKIYWIRISNTVEAEIADIEWELDPRFYIHSPKLILNDPYLLGRKLEYIRGMNYEKMIKEGWGIGAKIKLKCDRELLFERSIQREVLEPSTEVPTPKNCNCGEPIELRLGTFKCKNHICPILVNKMWIQSFKIFVTDPDTLLNVLDRFEREGLEGAFEYLNKVYTKRPAVRNILSSKEVCESAHRIFYWGSLRGVLGMGFKDEFVTSVIKKLSNESTELAIRGKPQVVCNERWPAVKNVLNKYIEFFDNFARLSKESSGATS